MGKDPAFLFYYKDFDISTAAWDADVVGWYLRLLCYQADAGALPADLDTIATIARVKPSQWERFKLSWQLQLEAKFVANDQGGLVNRKLEAVQQERKTNGSKKAESGLVGSFVKRARAENSLNEHQIKQLAGSLFKQKLLEKTEAEREACYQLSLKLQLEAIKGIAIATGDAIINEIGKGGVGEKPVHPLPEHMASNEAAELWERWLQMRFEKTNDWKNTMQQEAALIMTSRIAANNGVGDDAPDFLAFLLNRSIAEGRTELKPEWAIDAYMKRGAKEVLKQWPGGVPRNTRAAMLDEMQQNGTI